jgi:hypothetical protein
MSSRLLFPDPRVAADLLTFAGRATPLGDGRLRLVAENGILSVTAAPLAPLTLLEETPTVLGMRVMPVDPELVCDLVVDAAALTADAAPDAVLLPDVSVSAPWAGVSPPRGGWTRVGAVAASIVAMRAQAGIAAVAQSLPESPGEDVVRSVRGAVWGATEPELAGLPAGVAFAAVALGFIGGDEEATMSTSGAWTRVTFARGHVLTRTSVRAGLTPVRATGRG